MGKKAFRFFRIWGNLVIGAITVYPFVVTYLLPSSTLGGGLTSLFGWPWQTWLIILLVSIILTLLAQNWIEKYEDSKAINTSTNTRTTTVDHNSFTMQGVNGSPVRYNSPDTNINWNPPPGFETPSRQQLMHIIGVDIQKFRDKFISIRYKKPDEKWNQYVEANKIFSKINTELLFHANIILKDTQIPWTINQLSIQMTKYSLRISELSYNDAERISWGKGHMPIPKDVIDRVNEARDSLSQLDQDIESLVNQLIELATKPPPSSVAIGD